MIEISGPRIFRRSASLAGVGSATVVPGGVLSAGPEGVAGMDELEGLPDEPLAGPPAEDGDQS